MSAVSQRVKMSTVLNWVLSNMHLSPPFQATRVSALAVPFPGECELPWMFKGEGSLLGKPRKPLHHVLPG